MSPLVNGFFFKCFGRPKNVGLSVFLLFLQFLFSMEFFKTRVVESYIYICALCSPDDRVIVELT